MKFWRGFFLGLLSTAACSWWMAGRPGWSGEDAIIHDHGFHADSGASCSDCHEGIEDATDLNASYLPNEEACLLCHNRDEGCDKCHTNVEDRTPKFSKAEPHLGFDHAAHMALDGMECARCHAGAESEKHAGVPTMDVCLGCHQHEQQYARGVCLNCHTTMQSMPLRAVAEFQHGPRWDRAHGAVAKSEGETCLSCHTQQSCSDCHSKVAPAMPFALFPERVEKWQLHRGDFAATHAVDARSEPATCLRCHGSQFCVSCHELSGLTDGGLDSRSPHPAGYGIRGGSAFHGDDARMQIETCAACHDRGPASICVDCHRVGGVGGNPHPPGWRNDYVVDDIEGRAMCLVCHQ